MVSGLANTPGRPKKLTPDLVHQADELRGAGYSWRQISEFLPLDVSEETVRVSVLAYRKKKSPGSEPAEA